MTDVREPPFRGWVPAVIGVVALAGALRFWKLWWGLDDGMPFSDEATLWRRYTGDFVPLRLESFDRPDRPQAFLYPTLQGYLVGLSTWLATAMGWAASPWVEQVSGLRVGRVLAASESVLVVCLVGLLAARLHSVRAGLFAAAFMAVLPVPVLQAHYISTDPLAIFFMTAAVWVAIELERTPSAGLAFAGGLLVGLAFGTKYSGLIAGVAIAWAALEVAWREASARPFVVFGLSAVSGLAVGFVVACPLCVWRPGDLAYVLGFYGALTSFEHLLPWRVDLAPGLGGLGRPYAYQLLVGLPFIAGWAVYALGVAGTIAAVRRWRAADRLLVIPLGVYLFVAGLSRSFELRYMLHLVPLLVLLAALFLAGLERRRLAAGLFSIAFAYTGAVAVSQVARLSFGHQWDMALWFDEIDEARETAPVVAIPASYLAFTGVETPFERVGVPLEPRGPGEWLRDEPEFVIVPDLLADSVRTRPLPQFREELDRIESGEAGYTLVREWRSGFFTDSLYTSLDPVLAGGYTQGAIGFRVYERPGR